MAFAASALLPAFVAYVIGAPVLRLRHFYLAMATLAFSEIMAVVFVQEIDITGGPTGITKVPSPVFFGFALDTPERYYYLVWIVAAAVVMFSHNIIESKYGRALRAISDNETAASAMGVDVVLLVIMVAVGGVKSLWGAVLGAVFITVLPSFLGTYKQYAMLVYGFILVLALMFMPDGIAGVANGLLARIRRGRGAPADRVSG